MDVGRRGLEIDAGGRISLLLIADISVTIFVTNLDLQSLAKVPLKSKFEEFGMC